MYSKLDSFNHINVNLVFFFEFILNKDKNGKIWKIKNENKKDKIFFEIA
jgi:hypothetical protein